MTPVERFQIVDTGLNDEMSINEFLSDEVARRGEPFPGRNGQLIERVTPMSAGSAHVASLSASYGQGPLPFHLDTAHRIVPARLVIIACVNPGTTNVPTRLIDWNEISLSQAQTTLLKTATFLMRTGRRSFYSTILSDQRSFVRYDPGCMWATDARALEASAVMDEVLATAEPIVIEWQIGRTLILNNWRMFHARGDATASEERVLLRSCVR